LQEEVCNETIVKLAALLHDIADSKFNNGDEVVGPETARTFLESEDVDGNHKSCYQNHREHIL
jgi:uncharacterized protein